MGLEAISAGKNGQGIRSIEIASTKLAETSIILHDKKYIAKMSLELNVQTPTFVIYSVDLITLYNGFIEVQITAGDVVTLPSSKGLNFADIEGNYLRLCKSSFNTSLLNYIRRFWRLLWKNFIQ